MQFHIMYRDRDDNTEVGRVNAPNRLGAIRAATVKYNVPATRITSAVALPDPKPVEREERPCLSCHGTGKHRGPYGEAVRCRNCYGTGCA